MNTWPQVPRYGGGSRGERATWPDGLLPPIEWEDPPITPLPEVIELPAGEGWMLWDAAVATQDALAFAARRAAGTHQAAA